MELSRLNSAPGMVSSKLDLDPDTLMLVGLRWLFCRSGSESANLGSADLVLRRFSLLMFFSFLRAPDPVTQELVGVRNSSSRDEEDSPCNVFCRSFLSSSSEEGKSSSAVEYTEMEEEDDEVIARSGMDLLSPGNFSVPEEEETRLVCRGRWEVSPCFSVVLLSGFDWNIIYNFCKVIGVEFLQKF